MALKDIRFLAWLGIVSALGFIFYVLLAFGLDLRSWNEGILFLVVGFAIFLLGGARFFKYFEDGRITWSEANRMFLVALGFSSMVVGVLVMPVFGVQAIVLDWVKALIATIAVFTILADTLPMIWEDLTQ